MLIGCFTLYSVCIYIYLSFYNILNIESVYLIFSVLCLDCVVSVITNNVLPNNERTHGLTLVLH